VTPEISRRADRTVIDHLWFDQSVTARAGRVALAPVAAAYRVATRIRGAMYDVGLLPVRETAIPALSVGNLTVGGTGKTPMAAWMAGALAARHHRPAVVLRGYGDGDEAAVHRVLNPSVTVVVSPDRVEGVRRAAAAGCDVAVLDDAFQHRRARRVADVVLVSADAWASPRWPLPSGPWREPLSALRRATVIIVTRKIADDTAVATVVGAISAIAPRIPVAVASFEPCALRTLAGATRPLTSLRGARVRAVAGVATPASFFAQLRGLGADVDGVPFADHHPYTGADVAALQRGATPGTDVICTLKDAVKLDGLWPREPGGGSLWYVSQRVEFERGVESVYAALDAVPGIRPSPDR
jgi:tetraacyldisaccharide 4'-kinase